MNNRTTYDPYIQALGVDVSRSPPRTCAVLTTKLPNGKMLVHDEWHWGRTLTAEEVEQFRKNVAKVLLKTPLGLAMNVDVVDVVDVVDFDNWNKVR